MHFVHRSVNYLPTLSTLIKGSGFAQITYLRIQGTTSFFASGVVYIFGATEPIPEPATLVLFGTGLAGVAAKVRRREGGAGRRVGLKPAP